MKEVNYFEILKKAFFMTWNTKSMWFFGFLVFIDSFTATFNNSESSANRIGFFSQPIQAFNHNHPLIFAFIIFLLALAVAALYLLKIIATAALIKISNNIAVYEQANIRTIFSQSKEYVWRIFCMEILIGAIAFLIAASIIFPISYIYSSNSKSLAFIFLTFGFIIISILLILAFYLIRYSQIFLVLSDSTIKTALESAYELFEKNIKKSLMFGLISIGINFVFLFLLILFIFVFALAASLIGFLFYLIFANSGVFVFLVLAGIILSILLLSLFSWFNAFSQSVWVLFFQQLSLDKKEDKEEKDEELETGVIMPDPEAV